MLSARSAVAAGALLAWLTTTVAMSAPSFVKDDTVRCMRKGINGRASVSLAAAVTVRPNEGESGRVLEGPRRYRDTDWWRVDWGGRRIGWTAEHEPGRPANRYLDLVAFVRAPAEEPPPWGGTTQGPATPAIAPVPAAGPGFPAKSDRAEIQNLRTDVAALIEILGSLDARIDQRIDARGAAPSGTARPEVRRAVSLPTWLAGSAVLLSIAVLVMSVRRSTPWAGPTGLIESRLTALERRVASQAGPAIRQTTVPPAAATTTTTTTTGTGTGAGATQPGPPPGRK